MTMPSDKEIKSIFPTHPDHGRTIRMVPADIAEGLARALRHIVLNTHETDTFSIAANALRSYDAP